MELKLIISLLLLLPANYFGALRDWYFHNTPIKFKILKVYKDWHIVKFLNLGFLLVSFALAWESWINIGLWLICRWIVWEMALHFIDKNYVETMKAYKRMDLRKTFYVTSLQGGIILIVVVCLYLRFV